MAMRFSYERLHQLLGEIFHLSISEGAIANLLTRVKDRLGQTSAAILTQLRQAKLIGSDETNGRTEWEWVFQNTEVCFAL